MVLVGVVELLDREGCISSITELVKGSMTSYPHRAYVFSKEKVTEKEEAKWTELSSYFNPHTLLTNKVCCEGNGYFGCETSYDEKGKLKTCNTWFRCLVKDVRGMLPDKKGNEKHPDITGLQTNPEKEGERVEKYVWYEMTFFTRWEPDRCRMLCVNTPEDMQSKLEAVLSNGSTVLDPEDPFSMYVPLIDEIVKLYDLSVWAIRDLLRTVEKEREKWKGDFDADFSHLQEILRHSLHVGEVLSVTVGTTEEMRKCRRKILPRLPKKSSEDVLFNDKIHYHMAFQTQMMRNMRARQQSNQDRLQTEITLAYNMITQRDSRVLKGDSKAMKTVALLTMVFLPATFTSAIFSMSFFNFSPANGNEPEKWTISGKMYIFWVVAALLTAITMVVWYLWQYREGKDFRRGEKKLSKDIEV